MTPGTFDLNIYRGDSYRWRFQLWHDAEMTDPVILSGATVGAQMRDKFDGSTVLTFITSIEGTNIIDVVLTPALWATAPNNGGVWDLQVMFPDGDVQTYVAGKVKITKDVTAP